MRTSQFFLGTLREVPADAELISHQLMLRAGMIRKVAAGIYTWLPLGIRVLRNVEKVVREEMNNIGALEILMPAVQPVELWQESQRWQQYGPELLRLKDRHEREFCFGPTHEEIITDLFRREVRSYKQLPVTFYQIQMKFRDEIRPRFGVMRAREFLMKDAYSFHIDKPSLEQTYVAMYEAYTKIFTRLGLKFRAVQAATGNIGGNYSHEFQVLADAGEDLIAYSDASDYAANVELTGEVKEGDPSPDGKGKLHFTRGIEVGHIFQLGSKYSETMNATVLNDQGKPVVPLMGCYGIGVSRIVAAAIEQHHDQRGIIWSPVMAPFQIALVPLDFHKSAAVREKALQLYNELQTAGFSVLLDDRNERAGVLFADMDLLGIPHRLVISERRLTSSTVEYKARTSEQVEEIGLDKIISFLS